MLDIETVIRQQMGKKFGITSSPIIEMSDAIKLHIKKWLESKMCKRPLYEEDDSHDDIIVSLITDLDCKPKEGV